MFSTNQQSKEKNLYKVLCFKKHDQKKKKKKTIDQLLSAGFSSEPQRPHDTGHFILTYLWEHRPNAAYDGHKSIFGPRPPHPPPDFKLSSHAVKNIINFHLNFSHLFYMNC